jgi:hypothetical protein
VGDSLRHVEHGAELQDRGEIGVEDIAAVLQLHLFVPQPQLRQLAASFLQRCIAAVNAGAVLDGVVHRLAQA